MGDDDFSRELENTRQFFEKNKEKLAEGDLENVLFILNRIQLKSIAPTEEDKKNSDEAKNTGNDLFKEGKFEEALDLYNKAIELNPLNYLVYSNRALVYVKLGNTQKAIEDCLLGIEIEPSFIKFYIRLAFIYRETDKALADQYIEKGLKVEPDNAVLLELKGVHNENDAFDMSTVDSLLKNKGLQNLVQNFVKDKSPEELNTMMNDVLGKLGGGKRGG